MTDLDISSKIDDVKTSLTQQFALEIGKLEEIRAGREKERQDEVERKAHATQAKLDAMLELQIKEAEEKANRRSFWLKFVLGPSGVFAIGAAAIAGYFQAIKPPLTEEQRVKDAVRPSDVAEKVDKADDDNEQRFLRLEENDKVSARELIKQKIQLSDGFEHIGKKIDAAHPRTASMAEVPSSLKILKKRSDKIKDSPAGRRLLGDSEDPLVELAKETK